MTQNKFPIVGKWVSLMPDDSDDYLVEYSIAIINGEFNVTARDLQDGEEMEISDVFWDGRTLSFRSFMPSTKRSGHSQFRVKANGNIESKFTFTVLEELIRKKPEE